MQSRWIRQLLLLMPAALVGVVNATAGPLSIQSRGCGRAAGHSNGCALDIVAYFFFQATTGRHQ